MKGEHQPIQQPERAPEIEPKIYVASLSDYVSGRLTGDWMRADRDPDEINEDISQMLAKSREPHAEEWAIHDYEGFGAFKLGEYEDLTMVSKIASGIVEHGRPFSHWANLVGTQDNDRLDHFDDHYRGAWPSLADYAEDFVDDMGETVDTFTPGWLQPYVTIDYLALGNDLASDLETADDSDGTVHIFDADR